ncbi:S49 family peptidase [Marinobacterium jannaschii]|uniref:S49 family peptidase n=1 Tax=Marinobacterium jannaschii TaxID=64970 RepID=UPI0004842F8B|nr:S49 family peptidase [Marinobacterium jannaschii]
MAENHWNEPETSSSEKPANKVEAAVLAAKSGSESGKEWKLLEKLLSGLYTEQRRSRRWGIFFKALTFVYLFALLGLFWSSSELTTDAKPEAHVAVVEIRGAIADNQDANADTIIWALRDAFEADSSKAVLLRINSPGGSPVQSGYVFDEVKRLRALYPDKKVYAVITDIGASGAYYIAASADEIYADKASLVGSIGVVAGGFGYVDLMNKLGVERRLYTAGEHKAFLDPFSPPNKDESVLWQQVLNTTHQQFIEQVKIGRGDRLKDDPKLFSGLVWTGEQAVELGLIDGLGSSSYVARELVGVDELVSYMPSPSPWEQIADELGVSFARTISTQLGLGSTPQLR